MTYCKGCLSKQQKINELEEEITSLKSKLHYQERTAKEGFFCSGLRLIQGYGLLRAGSAPPFAEATEGRQGSGRDYEFFVAFYDMAGHDFVGRSGMSNFESTRRIT